MLTHVFLCAALTALLILLGWCLSAICLLPVQGKQIYMVITAAGDGESLEQQCRAYLLLKRFGVLRRPLLLVDAGLTEQGRLLVHRLSGLDADILVCAPEELSKLLLEEV